MDLERPRERETVSRPNVKDIFWMKNKRIRGLTKPSLKLKTQCCGSRSNDIFQYLSNIAVSDIRMCEHGSAAASGEMVLRYHLTW